MASVVAFSLACTVDANVGELDRDPRADAAATTNGEGDGDASSATATDSGDATAVQNDGGEGPAVGCGVTFAQQGAWVDAKVLQETIPSGNGGTITPGTYVLEAMRVYLGGGRGTAEVRETIVVKGSPSVGTLTRLSEVRNTSGDFHAHGAQGTVSEWEAQNIFLFGTPTCPSSSEPTNDRYSATASSLTIYDGMEVAERVYKRVP